MSEQTAFPLCWPPSRPQTPRSERKTNHNFKQSFAGARDQCLVEVKRLGGTGTIISSNIRIKANGFPEAVDWGKIIPEPGIAVYFTRKGKQLCFACDRWSHVQDNMHAIALTIEALRGIARWGTGDMMEAAFLGFKALPGPGESGGSSWWTTLGVPINAAADQVKEAHRLLVKKHHPDTGGDPEYFRRVQEAWRQFENQQKVAA